MHCSNGFSDICERSNCGTVKYTAWKIVGFTHASFLAYWEALQASQIERLRFEKMLHGFKVEGSGGDPVSKEEAKELLDDPLKEFPFDIDYSLFTAEAVGLKVKEFATYRKRIGPRELTKEEQQHYWNAERQNAYNGDDPIAKRCSVNGGLWVLYLYLKKKMGGSPEAALLKTCIRKDIALADFFPTEQDLRAYSKKTGARVMNTARPMEGKTMGLHLANLKKSGKLASMLNTLSCDGTIKFPKELLT